MLRLYGGLPSSKLPRRCEKLRGASSSPSTGTGSGLTWRVRINEALGVEREDSEADFLRVSNEEEVEVDRDLLLVCPAGVMLVFIPVVAQAEEADTIVNKDVACCA